MKPLANEIGEGNTSPHLYDGKSYLVEDEDTIRRNLDYSLSLGLPTIFHGPANKEKWIICAGGPSLSNEIEKIRRRKHKGQKIVALNGVHDYLIERGIVPDYMIMVDPKASNVKFVSNPNKHTEYLISGSCDPSAFDALQGFNLRIWFSEEDIFDPRIPMWIGGGSTVGLRAISIGIVLGFRNIHLYGFDGCLKDDQHHAYSQPENDNKQAIEMIFNDQRFMCHVWMANQARDFINFMNENWPLASIKVHTPGLIKAISDYFNKHIGEIHAST